MANYEFFSSMFKDFQVYGSSKLPPDWVLLGNFTGQNTRDRQYFKVKEPVLWTKFIRIEFKTNYGNEFYCPLTSVQIFGTTMMEEMKDLDNGLSGEGKVSLQNNSIPNPITKVPDQPTQTMSESIPVTSTVNVFSSTLTDVCINLVPSKTIELVEETSQIPSKSESVFGKIVARINHLEKYFITLEQGFQQIREFANKTNLQNHAILVSMEESFRDRMVNQVWIQFLIAYYSLKC